MALIDSRNKTALTTEQIAAILARNTPENLKPRLANSKIKQKNTLTRNRKAATVKKKKAKKEKEEEEIVPAVTFETQIGCVEKFPDIIPCNLEAHPDSWEKDRNVNISVAGLGAFNRYKSHPGRVFTYKVLSYIDPVGASDAAIKKSQNPSGRRGPAEISEL